MSLGDLFEACSFEELMPCLMTRYSVKTNLFYFKEAFDVCRELFQEWKEVSAKEDIKVPDDDWYTTSVISYLEKELSDEDIIYPKVNDFKEEPISEETLKECRIRINVHHLSFEWALVVPFYITKDLFNYPKGVLAANCLWELTFYGLPEDQEKVREEMNGEPIITNKYEQAYWDLFRKMCDNEYPKALRGKGSYPCGAELKHFNRSKRKRAHRQRKRCEVLKRMGKVENAIQRLSPIPRKDIEYLFQTEYIQERSYRSRTFGKHDRVDYLIELIQKYDYTDYEEDTRIAITVKASSERPITEEEYTRLKRLESRFSPSASIQWGIGTDDTLDEDISMLLLASC